MNIFLVLIMAEFFQMETLQDQKQSTLAFVVLFWLGVEAGPVSPTENGVEKNQLAKVSMVSLLQLDTLVTGNGM